MMASWYPTPYRLGWMSQHTPDEDVSKLMRFGGEFFSRCLGNEDERPSRSQSLYSTYSTHGGPRSLARPDRHSGWLGAPTLSTSSACTGAGLPSIRTWRGLLQGSRTRGLKRGGRARAFPRLCAHTSQPTPG